ncbi:conserved domain protein [Coleofasciculus chthonoplastes PCC 7420]|uniref:Conserved domain protein n=1 Tax=Coleofasciculus chthonoplastes PCC 7420 TaxID=118168 RepID=B4VUM2_9CYAN|nr:DUF928 domain-containing protein [Coleofasciculus chthonoplastes]EDX74443.1 conserved domain protein [Coleofasciculus chthonoplastes PCC 7420]
MTPAICQTLLSATVTGTIFLLTANAALARFVPLESEHPINNNLISVDFSLPDDNVPKSPVGGGVRGQVQFGLPQDSAPRSGVAGGVRGNVQFALPGGSAPRSGVAGGTRGDVEFSLPSGSAPRSGVAGGTRGDVEFSLPSGSAPRSGVAGGTRGDVEFSLPGGSAPRSGVAGGTRGDVEFSLPSGSAPRSGVAGGTRGDVEFSLPGGSAPRSGVAGGTREDVEFSLPADGKNPYTSAGGGIRGDVELFLPSEDSVPPTPVDVETLEENPVSDIPALTALVPPTKHGRTVSPRPTIYVYLPPIGARKVFFSIQDEAGNSHYHTILNVSPQGGVMAITLPPDTPGLEIDKNYLWYFAPIEPGGILRPDNYAVTGWIKRVENTVNEQEFVESPVKLATKYAEAGIWYDTLQVLVEAQQSEPKNETYSTEWHDLLEQVDLEAIASQPFVF